MENFVEPGESLTLTAPSGSPGGVVSGTPVLIGSLVAIPMETAAAGERFAAQVKGVYKGSKVATETWTEGLKIYYDNGPGLFTSTAGSNTLVGVASEAARAAIELSTDVSGSPWDLSVSGSVISLAEYANLAGKTITVRIPRDGNTDLVYVLTEGVDFDAETSNAVTATNIAAAITALPGVSAVASTVAGSPNTEIVTVTSDNPIPGHVRLDGVAR